VCVLVWVDHEFEATLNSLLVPLTNLVKDTLHEIVKVHLEDCSNKLVLHVNIVDVNSLVSGCGLPAFFVIDLLYNCLRNSLHELNVLVYRVCRVLRDSRTICGAVLSESLLSLLKP
jgi:hypothetical protein